MKVTLENLTSRSDHSHSVTETALSLRVDRLHDTDLKTIRLYAFIYDHDVLPCRKLEWTKLCYTALMPKQLKQKKMFGVSNHLVSTLLGSTRSASRLVSTTRVGRSILCACFIDFLNFFLCLSAKRSKKDKAKNTPDNARCENKPSFSMGNIKFMIVKYLLKIHVRKCKKNIDK